MAVMHIHRFPHGRRNGCPPLRLRTWPTPWYESPRFTILSLTSVMTAPPTAAQSFSLGKVQSRMPRKQTLQAFLSPQYLELAGPKVYARGEEYVATNRVQLYEHARDEAIAEVMGSQPYRVELRLTSTGLTADCTCPAISDYGFCKHAVALGLYLIKAPPPTDKKRNKSRAPKPDGFTENIPILPAGSRTAGSKLGVMATAPPLYEY